MASLARLREVVGGEHARDAGDTDAVDGARPRFVASPGTIEEVAALLRLAGEADWRVTPRGAGSKLAWGRPPERTDLVLRTARLNRVIEHAAGDLVVSVEAGLGIEELQLALASSGQMLGLDAPQDGATVGGLIATNASGPHRLRYGTVRDLLIGITVVLADGTVARSGGKVVKNVAGYDLGKLFTGSLGTLGVIVGATFRLHPRPAVTGRVSLELSTPEAAGSAVKRIMRSTLVPGAVELEWAGGAGRMLVHFGGIAPGVEAQTRSAMHLLADLGEVALVHDPVVDARRRGRSSPTLDRPGALAKITFLPADLAPVLRALEGATRPHGVTPLAEGQAANGVLYARLPDDAGVVAAIVTELRQRIGEGAVVLLEGPVQAKLEVDPWGPVGNALPLMRRVKEQFDPGRMLNPGRFVGGI